MLDKIIRILPAIIWSILIFIVCFIPGNELPKVTFLDKIYFDKIVHLSMYFILFSLLYFAKQIPVYAIILICLIQGIFIEYVQENYILNRNCDFLDILFNAIGVLVAFTYRNNVYTILEKYRYNTNKLS